MRAAPGSIPSSMPSIDASIQKIVYLMDMPRPRLNGFSIADLVNTYSDSSPKWLTGSTVWLPAVFGQVDEEADLDIVFTSAESAERFLSGALGALSGFTRNRNAWGSGRIVHPDGKHVIDAFHLEGDESIEELLLTYPSDYQRVAYFMTWSGASPGYLTRIIKKRTRIRESSGAYRRDIVRDLSLQWQSVPAPSLQWHLPTETAQQSTIHLALAGEVVAAPPTRIPDDESF